MNANHTTKTPPLSAPESSRRLFTFASGGWVLLIAGILTLISAGIVLLPVYQTGFRSAVGDGQHLDSYRFNLTHLTVPRDRIIPSGKAKDEVRAVPESLVETLSVPEIELMNKQEYSPFLVGSDRLIGLSIHGESRAYPVRLLNLHEIVNDRIGGTPIAVTWGPLSGSAAVFVRPTDGAGTMEFGVSGLLYQSNLLMFDRRSKASDESLWSQLGLRAISGPAAGKALTLLPFELTTWRQWSLAHPDTRVFRGLRTLKQAYTDAQDPFNMYLSNDNILFTVSPMWPHATPRPKTLLVLSTDDGTHWKAALAADASTRPATSNQIKNATPVPSPRERHLYAFLFAWYAQHSTDTDYSAILPVTAPSRP